MHPIIGLDFGNFNTFACFISDFDEGTRLGGGIRDLLPAKLQEGIPSVYFYSEKTGKVLLGENAVRSIAKPLQNRLKYLKRHLGETTQLDDRLISYDIAITEVIQHCIRRANEQLQNEWQTTSNIVCLSYPATYTFAQRQRLIELVENATLKDGTKVKVYGTIAEPAAAALDYLAEFAKSDKDTTVLTYDLGGGTFDLGLVSVYPKGRKNSMGDTYYYDIINTRGIPKLGGVEFDEVMFRLLSDKVKVPLNPISAGMLRDMVETIKVQLSSSNEEIATLWAGDDYIEIPITRSEFENASRDLLMKTIDETRKILQDHPNQKPEIILLTGGASQMPMVQREMENAFPQYNGKIVYFRPSRAIAYGAARFGLSEYNEDPISENIGTGIVQNRVMYDIGVRYFKGAQDSKGHIVTFINANTEIPYVSKTVPSTRVAEGKISRFGVYEANTQNPSSEEVERDFTEIMVVQVDHGRKVPEGHPSEARMLVDKTGKLTIEARDASEPDLPFFKAAVQLQNLS